MTTMNGQVDNVVTCVDDVYEHATNAKGMESSEVICCDDCGNMFSTTSQVQEHIDGSHITC